MTMQAKNQQAKIVLERTYKARPEELWALWTTKDGFESWWGPQGFRVEVHAMEARVGGRLSYDMIAAAPDMVAEMKRRNQPISHPTNGTFTEVEPHRRLVLTHLLDFIPGVAAYETRMTAEFFPIGDRVRMVITSDALHDAFWTGQQTEGMKSQLTKLDERFGTSGS